MLRKKKLWWALFLICLVVLGSAWTHQIWLPWVPQILMTRQPLEKADFIYLLGGDHYLRAPFAAKLFREGWAPMVLVPRQEMPPGTPADRDFTNVTIDILKKEGVSANRIVELFFGHGVTSTADEARALRNYVNQIPVRNVMIATSSLHSRRAYLAMRRALWGTGINVTVVSIDQPDLDVRHWWQKSNQRYMVALEYIKFVYYWLAFYR